MAQRRMFSSDIVDSDVFLDMPSSSQLLYFHLAMRADDDGFVNPKKIMRIIGVSGDDLKVLLGKRFLLPFESGVVVIKHWLIHNLIRADLYRETLYKKEKSTLGLNENGAYTELRAGVSELRVLEPPEWLKRRRGNLRTANVPQTVHRIGKDRLGKDNIADKSAERLDVKVIEHFFALKGITYDPSKQATFRRHLRPAKELLALCDGDLEEAKLCVTKLGEWAKSRDLDWSIETVFKKWYEIDFLKPKEKKPYWDGCRVYQKVKDGKWYIVRPDGIKELGFWPKREQLEWK